MSLMEATLGAEILPEQMVVERPVILPNMD